MTLDSAHNESEPIEHGVRRVEIEQRLAEHPSFSSNPVVVYEVRDLNTPRLIAFCQARHSQTSQTLRDRAAEVLPRDMIPDIFILIDAFPLTESGEFDDPQFMALAASAARQSTRESPAFRDNDVDVEDSVRKFFAEIFEVEFNSVLLDDDFFELGGSSLDCVELFALIEENFGVDLPLSTITRAPTVRLLAATIAFELRAGTGARVAGSYPADEWEWMLCILWSEVLGVAAVTPQDDLIDLGATPADFQRVTEQLGAIYGIHADLSDVIRAHSVAQLAALTWGRSTGSCLVPLQVKGAKPPFFCVAGLGGLALAFLPLSRELGADQPFYGLQSHGIDRRGLPDYTIKRTVDRYTKAIRSVQSHGPYVIGGHSFGGVLALEVAHRLAAEDEDVALLVLFDTVLPEKLSGEKSPSLIDPIEQTRRVGWLERRIHVTASDLLRLPVTGLVRRRGEAQANAFRLVGRVQTRLARRLRPWPGRTVIFVSDDQPQASKDYLLSTWARLLTGSWTHVSTPGDHLSMMQRPQVPQLARRLKELLAEATPLDGAELAVDDSEGKQRPI